MSAINTKHCDQCGTEFSPRSRYSRFCRAKCRHSYFQITPRELPADPALPPERTILSRPLFNGRGRIVHLREDKLVPPYWTPPDIDILSLENLRALTPVHDAVPICGVYFLWRDEKLIYVGSSNHIHSRIREHLKKPVPHTHATYMAVPSPWHLAVEAIYIMAHQPELNTAWLPKSYKKRSVVGT